MRQRTEAPDRSDPDLPLVEASRGGDLGAFDDLVRRHQDRVHRLACRLLGDAEAAQDAAQETFVRAWRGLVGFQGGARFSTWLTRILINQCRNEMRRRRTRKHAPPLSLDAPLGEDGEARGALLAAAGPSALDALRGREVHDAFEAAMADLDPQAREILVLREVEDLSYEDVAHLLDVAVGTVRSRLHRARAELRRRMARVLDA